MRSNSPFLHSIRRCFLGIALVVYAANLSSAQSCSAPNQCNPTLGFPEAPESHVCGEGYNSEAIFTESFDNGFGIFSEDSPPGPSTFGSNDLTLSTNGDTPSTGTGPETTAGCNGSINNGEFVFLEGSSTNINETHCMTGTISLPVSSVTTNTPFNLSFWYHMYGSNIGELEIFINDVSEFSVSGQQQTQNCQAWLQGNIDITALEGTDIEVRICMSEGNGSSSTFRSDIAIDHIQVFACGIPPCEIICPQDVTIDAILGTCEVQFDYNIEIIGSCPDGISPIQTQGLPSGVMFPFGTTTNTFSIVDLNGNTNVCSFDVTVENISPPPCIANDITVSVESGETTLINRFMITGSDEDLCGLFLQSISIYPFSVDCSNIGDNEVTLTVLDMNGNSATCISIVTVETEEPLPVCMAQDLTISLGENGLATITPDDIDNGSADGCGSLNKSIDKSFFTCADVGSNLVTLTITDEAGNEESCSAQVFVEDILPMVEYTAPADLCLSGAIQNDLTGGLPIGGVYSGPGVTDDENGSTYSFDPTIAGVGEHSLCYSYSLPSSFYLIGQDINGDESDDRLGRSVSTSFDGNVIAVGAPRSDFIENNAGQVKVFIWDEISEEWTQKGQDLYGDMDSDFFGWKVNLSFDGNIVAIGIPLNDSNGTNAGQVRIYEWNESTQMWFQKGQGINGQLSGDTAGISLSLSSDGNVIAVGSPPNSNSAGQVRIFEWDNQNSIWLQKGQILEGDIDNRLGRSISISSDGDIVSIGAPGGTNEMGKVKVYDWETESMTWIQRGEDILSEEDEDDFGESVSLSSDGNIISIGAPLNDFNGASSGMVKVYEWDSDTLAWINRGQNIYGSAPSDVLGSNGTLSISSDGSVLVIGLLGNDDGGSNAGKVQIFDWNGNMNIWTFRQEILGEAIGDLLGRSLSISDDGSLLAVGAARNDEGGLNAGHVRLFRSTSCSIEVCDALEIVDPPTGTITFNQLDAVCVSDDIQTELGSASPEGGTFSGPGVTDDGNGLSFSFDPSIGVGIYSIMYEYFDPDGCSITGTSELEVMDLPIVTFTAPIDIPFNAGIQTGLSGGLPLGGIYSGPGVTDDGNGLTFSFDPNQAGHGNHTIFYTFTDSSGCSNFAFENIEVLIAFEALDDLCLDSGLQTGLAGGLPSGGVYSGPGVEFDTIDMTYSFDPSIAGVGVHELTYSIPTSTNQMGSDIDGEMIMSWSGYSVSSSQDGNRIVIGAPRGNNTYSFEDGFNYTGSASIFEWNGMEWVQLGMDINGVGLFDFFGSAVSISANGDRVAIGAIRHGANVGHVQIFDWDGNVWNQVGNDIDGDSGGDECGVSVSLSSDGNRIAIGANKNDDNGFDSGQVRIFGWDGSTWNQMGLDIDGESSGDQNGLSVSISADGERVAIGAINNSDNGLGAGQVRIFDWDGNSWIQLGMDIDGEAAGDKSGSSVALSSDGNRVAVGAPKNSGFAGHVRVYDWDGSSWNQVGIDIDGVGQSGISVSLSDDGNRLAVGAPGYEDLIGQVLLYDWDGMTWNQIAEDINGEGDFDASGGSVSLSGDGKRVVIGASGNAENGFEAGHTRIYEINSSDPATDIVEVFDCDYEIEDPCACLDNATIIDLDAATGGNDGQFSEIVSITNAAGTPLPSGQTWTIVGATGALDANNIPAVGTQSAGVPLATDGSEVLIYNAGIYEVEFVHVDDIGYTMSIEGPFPVGDAANVTLTISNKCIYPNPVFDPIIPSPIYAEDPTITLGGSDTNGNGADATTFAIDGMTTTTLDPTTFTMGDHEIVMTYDGADDGNGGISPDGGTTAASPGCTQEVQQVFEIIICELIVDCSNITNQDIACIAELPVADITLPIITDACGEVTITETTDIPTNTGCPGDEIIITRTYSIVDENDNMDECVQTFTVLSTLDPTFTFFPSDTTVLCGADTDPTATGLALGVGECDPELPLATVAFVDVTLEGSCAAESTITRTWTVTDRCGRSVDMDQTIMIVDTIAPIMECQDITLQLDEMGMVTVVPADIDNGSNDNCGGVVALTLNISDFTCDNIGENMVMLIGTDECGNQDSCMTNITIEDDTPPAAICQDITVQLDADGMASIEAADVDNGSSDICGAVTLSIDVDAFTCDNIGDNVVTLLVTDESDNTSECEATVVVEDNIPPNAICQDITVQLDADGMASIEAVDVDNGSSDICGGVALSIDIDAFTCDNIGDNLVILTVTDESDNTSECNATVTVEDNIPPEAICKNISISLDENGETTLIDGVDFLINNGSNDNCTDAADLIFSVSQSDFTCADLIAGQASTDIQVTLTVEDEAGLTASCDATVSLMDDIPPSISCPANINIALDAGDCDRVVDYSVLAEDNCGLLADAEGNTIIQTTGLPSGSIFERGITTNTFQVTDLSGNVSSCSFDVVVVENPDPVTALSCNGNLNISLDENCEAFIGADQILEGGGYGCYDDYILEIEGINGQTIFAPGTYTITIIDPDTGNSCWSEVTVEDKLEPTLVCTECPPGATSMIELPFTGTLDADSPIWTRPFGQPATCAPSGAGVDVPYSTHEFLVVTGADSDFENVSFTAPSADFFMVLYQDSFDPLNPCGNMVINNDDGGGGLLSQFDVMLESGVQYILVATTFNNNGNDFGDYIIELDSEAILIDAPAECLFKCFDETAILAGVMPVPSPVAMDNCVANLPTFYTDVVTEGAICGSKVITRTFSITGADGNVITSCVAEYQLFAAQFSDFTPPPAVVELPCGTGTSPEEIEAFFDDPTTNDITNPNCPLDVIENNEGTTFGYLTYATLGCDGNTHLQKVDNNQCGFFTTYSDQVIPSCGAACGSENVKVIRTWTILDWCNPDDAPFTYIQVIKSEDTEAPTIEVANDFTVGVNPWNCLGDFSLPAPTLLHDLCSSEITYTVSGPVGTTLLAPNTTNNPSDYWVVFGAPKGTASFTYTAADCCGNTSSAELLVNIFDTTPPVPVATENIIINLTTSGQLDENGNALGFAKLFTNSVDDGSYDGCSGVKIEIARESDACDESGNTTFNADGHPDDGSPNPNASNYDPDGGEFVKFCCADIDQVDPVTGVAFGLVEVRMRVFDDGNMTGFYGDFVDNNGDGDVLDAGEYDNFNETWVTVRVEGKAISSIVCPPDVTLACDMDYTDPAMIGSATTLALCGSESVDVSFTPQLNACGIGFVIATYTVAGSSPSISCSQRITIENPYPAFDPDGIRFPRDLPTSPTGQIACDDDITYDAPTWTAGACDFIGYTEEVDTFFFEVDPETGVPSDACFKILRRFTVIDWCVYDETNGADGLYDGNQTIKITDREAPVLLDCAPQMFEVDANCVRESTILTNMAEDNGDCASDWLKWQVFVDTWADGIVDYEYSSFLPTNDSNINNDTNGNGINDRYLAPTSSGEEVEITVAEVIESSMFNHLVTWKVTDGCGNVASCTTTFMVVDKKAPTPYCVSLSTALMQNSQPVELWAIDFDLGAFDNCTDQDDLRFTFSSTPPEDDNSYNAALRSSAQSFGTAGVIPVNVYVWDEKGNADFCTVSLTVIDNGGTGLRVAGITATELGNGVSEADVIIEANLDEYPRTVATDESGAYAFESNPSNIDYEVTVNKNDNHTNGVSTLDLVLIQRHIVGFGDLDSPYKVIAADINSDEKVSSIDVVELRKLILGVQDEFEYNTSWRFVDVAQEFADIQSPWPIDENRSISDLTTDLEAENFVAVKIGDVNATATHNVVGVSTEVRSATTMLLEVADRAVVAGEQVEIAVSSSDFNAVSGLQMTIEFNGLSFNDVAGKAISVGASNVGVLSENIITMSWNSNTSISTTEDLFVITAMATKDGFISEMINVTDRVIRPEVYVGSNLEIQNVQLGIRGGSVITAVSELMQNEPNPFKASTLISFNLATAGKATLTVRDVAGKVIRTVNGEYAAGLNTITLEKSELNAEGLLFYTLESGKFSDSKKMIVIE